MVQRLDAFQHQPMYFGDDNKLKRGVVVRCPCGAEEKLPSNTFAMPGSTQRDQYELELQFVKRRLVPRGWFIGRRKREHRCPKCNAIRTTTKQEVLKERIEPMAKEMPLQVVKPVEVVQPPRAMSREDRRIIFEKLNEVYVNEKTGYANDWTDQKVATHLGVPLQWVKVIRDENFGDEVSNEDIRKTLSDAKEAVALVRQLEPDIKRMLALADRIERAITECERALR
ncbi:hypothetical protein [Bradyrhizobium ottawaense]|uniref:hypothetical protein n=1 Tax=Bradyrhizobium ottawaense TaxID=931866 RepID=UPI0030F435B4